MDPTSNKSQVMLLYTGHYMCVHVGKAQWTERSDTRVIPVSDGFVLRVSALDWHRVC